MSNSVYVDVFERKDLRTDAVDYTVVIADDNDSTTLIFAEKSDIPENDMELLSRLIKAKHEQDEHGTSSDVVADILEWVYENKGAIRIGDKRYEWSEIKDVMKYDYRTVIFCPKCEWESFSDDDYDHNCLRDYCDGTMTEIRTEEYER